MQQLKSSMRIVDETASQISNQLASVDILSFLANPHVSSPSKNAACSPSQEKSHNPPESKQALPQNSSPADSRSEARSNSASAVKAVSLPLPTMIQSSHRPNVPLIRNPSVFILTGGPSETLALSFPISPHFNRIHRRLCSGHRCRTRWECPENSNLF